MGSELNIVIIWPLTGTICQTITYAKLMCICSLFIKNKDYVSSPELLFSKKLSDQGKGQVMS